MKKKIIYRIIYSLIMIIVSFYVFIYSNNIYSGDNADYISGFGFGFFAVSLVILIGNIIILNDPKKIKDTKINETDERNINILTKSYALTFKITVTIEAIMCIIFTLSSSIAFSCLMGCIIGFQLLIFLFSYTIISKKI